MIDRIGKLKRASQKKETLSKVFCGKSSKRFIPKLNLVQQDEVLLPPDIHSVNLASVIKRAVQNYKINVNKSI